MLFLDTDERFKAAPEETFIWVVTKSDVHWVRSDLGTRALEREVAALRCGLDYDGTWGAETSRCEAGVFRLQQLVETLAAHARL